MKNVTPKLKITGVESLDSAAGDLVRRRIELTQARAQMEAEMAAVEKLHEPRIQAMVDMCAWIESSVAEYLEGHREVLGERKSRETPLCVYGFRQSTRLETANRKIKWCDVVERCQRFDGDAFLSYKPPVVNKEAFHAAREFLLPARLDKLGVRFVTEDTFFLDAKPETAANQ